MCHLINEYFLEKFSVFDSLESGGWVKLDIVSIASLLKRIVGEVFYSRLNLE